MKAASKMIAPSLNSHLDSLIEKNVKVRYVLKRLSTIVDKYMGSDKRRGKEATHEKPKYTNERKVKKQKLLQYLRRWVLASRKYADETAPCSSSAKRKRQPRKGVVAQVPNDKNFALPRIFECDYCPRIYFNHTIYRRHVIKHMRTQRCEHCNQPFKTRAAHQRHQIICKRVELFIMKKMTQRILEKH